MRSLACGAEAFCLLCYANRRGRSNYRGHSFYVKPARKRRFTDMALNRRDPAPEGEHILLGSEEGELSRRFPTVWEFLTRVRWDDGKARETGTILLFVDTGVLKACISDRDAGEVAFLSGHTLESLLETIDTSLSGNSLEWRPARNGGKKKR